MAVIESGREIRGGLHVPAGFAPAEGEAAVLSIVAVRDGDEWVLASGSLLTVPRGVAAASWRIWEHRQPSAWPRSASTGFDPGPVFVVDPFPGVRLARQIVERREWESMVEALDSGEYATGVLRFAARVSQWSSTVLLGTQGSTPAHEAVDGACRPVSGIVGTLDAPPRPAGVKGIWELPRPPHLLPGRELGEIHRHRTMTGWSSLVGIDWRAPEVSAPPAALVVGRVRSEAWMARVRPDYDNGELAIDIGWEASEIDPLSCSVTIRSEKNGLPVMCRQIRISDLPSRNEELGQEPRTVPWDQRTLTVAVPRGPRRTDWGATLLGSDGRLLDELPVVPRIESIHLSLTLDGAETAASKSVIGDREDPPDASQRDEAVAQALALEEAARVAAAQRRISTAGELERYLRWRFSCIAGELLIVDPYLLSEATAETLVLPFLRQLDRPIRALTKSVPTSVAAAVGGAQTIVARPLPHGARTAHDRVWIVGDTGLLVGGSANTFIPSPKRGSSPATTVAELSRADVSEWRGRFAQWWDARTAG